MTRKLFLFFIFLLIIAVTLVPSQADYFERLEQDFQELHPSHFIKGIQFKRVGVFEYRNHLIFSEFDFSIGDFSVSYYGFLNIILFKSSRSRTQEMPEITV